MTMSIEQIEQHNRTCDSGEHIPLPPIQCQPWCEAGAIPERAGHRDCFYREDQYCWGSELKVDLSLEPQVEIAANGGGHLVAAYVPDWLNVFLEQYADQAEPHIVMERFEGTHCAKLTPAEARELIQALQLVLGQVRA